MTDSEHPYPNHPDWPRLMDPALAKGTDPDNPPPNSVRLPTGAPIVPRDANHATPNAPILTGHRVTPE